jgi:uncharacterized iron-regulated membrane protein
MTRLTSRLRAAWDDEHGVSEVIGLVFFTVPIVFFIALLAWAGKTSETVVRVDQAADSAAQAAALQRNPTNATSAATTVATTSLGAVCVGGPTVNVDTSTFAPGDFVSVTIDCAIATTDGFSSNMSATATAVIDRYRQP